MASEFEAAVEQGLFLTKRLYYGKEPVAVPPKLQAMLKSSSTVDSYLPSAISVYAVVSEPEAVDNPDVPSYQPYVHGKCNPPALIPLQMIGPVQMDVRCWLEHAIVTLSSSWRIHCIKAGRRCSCLLALPLEKPGSLLGVDVAIAERHYKSKFVSLDEDNDSKDGNCRKGAARYINGNTYTVEIPQVQAASVISVTVTWSQQLTYNEGELGLQVPFTFPAYSNPNDKSVLRKQHIMLSVFSGADKDINLTCSSHAIEENCREGGMVGFLYQAHVSHWSTFDFKFSYRVCCSDICGIALSQSQNLTDPDDRNTSFFYVFPGNNSLRKNFKKDIVFLIDTSKSMEGIALEAVKNELLSLVQKLTPQDTFNIIAFNGNITMFSPSMELAVKETVAKATHWLNDNLMVDSGTNILLPLQQALKLLGDSIGSMPLIFLITDGTVDDERMICKLVQDSQKVKRTIAPRICTFGIGPYCNRYFLQMLAQISRGYFSSSPDSDSIHHELQKLFLTASSTILMNITIEGNLTELELLPSTIPDLSSECPLTVIGKHRGSLSNTIKLRGILSDMSNYTLEVKVQKTTNIPLDRVFAGRYIEAETARAWFLQSSDIERKVARLSVLHGIPSEYSRMLLVTSKKGDDETTSTPQKIMNKVILLKDTNQSEKSINLGCSCVGFGDLTATVKNTPLKNHYAREPDSSEKLVMAAADCCNRIFGPCWCCVYVIGVCSSASSRCCNILSQICAAMACCRVVECCYELCDCE